MARACRVLQPAQRGRAAQAVIATHRRLPDQVMPQRVVVRHILSLRLQTTSVMRSSMPTTSASSWAM
jgi:hypothetical protein